MRLYIQVQLTFTIHTQAEFNTDTFTGRLNTYGLYTGTTYIYIYNTGTLLYISYIHILGYSHFLNNFFNLDASFYFFSSA